jgi:hypothetical protein
MSLGAGAEVVVAEEVAALCTSVHQLISCYWLFAISCLLVEVTVQITHKFTNTSSVIDRAPGYNNRYYIKKIER